MHAHTPPFTAKTAKQVYDETSATAAAQDAKLDPISAVESKARTAMQYLYHAQLLLKEAFPSRDQPQGIPAELAYLASFAPNADIPEKSPLAGSRIATPAEVAYLRKCGIGDVAETATTVASQHPAHAEAIRIHDERLNGPEDHL